MTAEKNLRGVLRSEVDRSVSKDCVVIVDSLNNIKVRLLQEPLIFHHVFGCLLFIVKLQDSILFFLITKFFD